MNILVAGPSGSGKSSSLIDLNPKTSFIINTDMKDLPFRGSKEIYKTVFKKDKTIDYEKSNFYSTNNPTSVYKLLNALDKIDRLKTIVLDTITHVLIHEFMRRSTEGGFDKWNEMAEHVYKICKFTQHKQKNYVIFSLIEKSESDENIRTVGKLLSEKIDIPSLFTIVLRSQAKVVNTGDIPEFNYIFRTKPVATDDIYKSPINMFDFEIPNRLNKVLEIANNYYDTKKLIK